MSIYLKVGISVLLILLGVNLYLYNLDSQKASSENICQDYNLMNELIIKNNNPFSKFKFLKKRNNDCKALLITSKDISATNQDNQICSALDDSTNSVTMLIYTYINELYDREKASEELKSMVELMMPYNYCPQFYNNMVTLVELKKRQGL